MERQAICLVRRNHGTFVKALCYNALNDLYHSQTRWNLSSGQDAFMRQARLPVLVLTQIFWRVLLQACSAASAESGGIEDGQGGFPVLDLPLLDQPEGVREGHRLDG